MVDPIGDMSLKKAISTAIPADYAQGLSFDTEYSLSYKKASN